MKIMLLSSLIKVFSDEQPVASEVTGFSVLKNERASFQIAVFSEDEKETEVKIEGFGDSFSIFKVREVPVGLACFDDVDDYFLRKDSGMYPDCLEPVCGTVKIDAGKWQSIWIELNPDGKLDAGDYKLDISLVSSGKVLGSKELCVEIINVSLPKQELIYTNWYHCDGLLHYYDIEAMSEDFWQVNRSFIKTAVDHGMNMILTPLFTPPLDTAVGGERRTVQLVGVKRRGAKYSFDFRNLKKWIDLCLECSVEYFEMSHLFTQWGAKHAPKIVAADRKGRLKKIFGWKTRTHSRDYINFLRQFAAALTRFLEKEGVADRCFFHISDEPGMGDLPVYRKRAELINEIFKGYPVIDALSKFEFYKTGCVKLPIPAENHIEDFYGRVDELWTYYCCGQCREYVSNRFMAMPSQRTRVIGCQLYKYDVKGFLQWGYNFYNSSHSKKEINPYEVTDAGGSFPAGDSFVVYPSADKTALPSLRLKVFYDALQDLRALKLLESLAGREKTLAVLEDGLETPLDFSNYPRNDAWQLGLRERINSEIKKHI